MTFRRRIRMVDEVICAYQNWGHYVYFVTSNAWVRLNSGVLGRDGLETFSFFPNADLHNRKTQKANWVLLKICDLRTHAAVHGRDIWCEACLWLTLTVSLCMVISTTSRENSFLFPESSNMMFPVSPSISTCTALQGRAKDLSLSFIFMQ